MMPSPATKDYPSYRVTSGLPSPRVAEDTAANIDAAILAHPWLVNQGTSVGDSTLATQVQGLAEMSKAQSQRPSAQRNA